MPDYCPHWDYEFYPDYGQCQCPEWMRELARGQRESMDRVHARMEAREVDPSFRRARAREKRWMEKATCKIDGEFSEAPLEIKVLLSRAGEEVLVLPSHALPRYALRLNKQTRKMVVIDNVCAYRDARRTNRIGDFIRYCSGGKPLDFSAIQASVEMIPADRFKEADRIDRCRGMGVEDCACPECMPRVTGERRARMRGLSDVRLLS